MRLLLAVLLLALSAFASAQTTLYSKTFHVLATGGCDGQDRLAWLSPDGASYSQYVNPWESVPIKIVGVKITFFDSPVQYAYAGNNYSPNQMVWVAKGEMTNAQPFFPAGLAFPFPAAPSSNYIDLHYNCTSGAIQGFYTVYYTK